MPLGSSKLGFFGEGPQGEGVQPYPSPESNITPNSFTITGNNAVVLSVTTNDVAYYNSNLQISAVGTNANVFTDNESTSTVAIDGSGNGTLLKRINGNITASANVQFQLQTTSGGPLFTTSNVSISGFPWVAASGGTVVRSNGMVYHYLTTNSDTFTITNVQNTANIHALVVGGGGHGGGWDHTNDSYAVQQFEPFGGNSNVVLNDAALAGGGGGGQMYHLRDISLTSANVNETATVTIGTGGSDTTTNSRGGNTGVVANFHANVIAIGGGGGASAGYTVSGVPGFPNTGYPAGGRTIGNPINTNGDVAGDNEITGTTGGGASKSLGLRPSVGDWLPGESEDFWFANYQAVYQRLDYSTRGRGGFVKPSSVTMANGSSRLSSTDGSGGHGGDNMGIPSNASLVRNTIPYIANDTDGADNTAGDWAGVGFPLEYWDYYKNVVGTIFPQNAKPNDSGVYAPYFGLGGPGGGGVGISTPADTTSTRGYGAGGDANYPGANGVVVYSYQDSTYTGNWVLNK